MKTRVSDGARAALTIEAPGLKLGSVLARYPEGRRQRLLTPHATEPLAEYSFKVGGVACSLLFSEADENLYVREISLEFMPERGR
ncbi:hypothetical protein [Chitinimonas sp.]|uniref:hypothetical protein n=1 Tax=Chitinimonas sp. TaxID=1934313 RepID=UPI002F95F62A